MAGISFARFVPPVPVPPLPTTNRDPDALTGPLLRVAIKAATTSRDWRRLAILTRLHPATDVPGIARFYLRQQSAQAPYLGGRSLRRVACQECDAILRRGPADLSDWQDGSGDYIQPRPGAEAKAAERAEREAKHLALYGGGE